MTNEEIIAKFLKAINQWIEAGCLKDSEYLFTEGYALCANLQHYLMFKHPNRDYECYKYFQTELLKGEKYPFNKGVQDFEKELLNGSFYENTARLAFIIRHMEK